MVAITFFMNKKLDLLVLANVFSVTKKTISSFFLQKDRTVHLNSLVKNLNKDDFKYWNQELDSNVLDLGKYKQFYPCEYMSDFEKFKEELPRKENLIVL